LKIRQFENLKMEYKVRDEGNIKAMIKEEIITIENALKRPLPGKKAQFIMAPGYRPDYNLEEGVKFNPRIGGVLLLLDLSGNEIQIILTLRKQYDGTHSGQMSFPGGKQESTDADLTQTALRETHEEIGVDPSHIRIIGHLSELYIPPSNFLVYPSVGVMSEAASFKKEDDEVEEIVSIPLSFFLDEKNRSTTKIKVMGNTTVDVPAYVYGNYTIWGATAIMLSEFVYILTNK
jgi:8-oxo-dGTP pyrophosphatase MutT (NUDIX family)